MNCLKKIHSLAIGNRCFGEVYSALEIRELLELEVDNVDKNVARSVDRLLLKLTAIRRLFHLYLSGKRTCGKLNDVCCYLITNDIIRKLVFCLEDTNQHVVFMASKAISSLMVSMSLSPTTRSQLERLFQDHNSFQWKSLYVMNILKRVMEGCFGDEIHNLIEQGMTPSFCNCISSELLSPFSDGEKNNIDLLEFVVSQDWITILPFYVPFWKEIFIHYLDNAIVSKDPKDDLLEHHLKLNLDIHQKLIQGCFEISTRGEQVFESFLSFLSEFFKQGNLIFCCKEALVKDVCTSRSVGSITELESNEEIIIQKIIPVMAHVLHVKKLSSEVWKEILKLLSYFLTANTGAEVQGSPTKYALDSAAAYICAVNCCILDNIPVISSIEGFGGNVVTPVKEDLKQNCKTKPTLGVFRQASLLVMQASLILFNHFEKYENDNHRIIFKSINTWYDGLLKITLSNHETLHKNEPTMILMEVFTDQDDEMIEIMLLLLKLFKVLSRVPLDHDTSFTVSTLNPHSIFQAFLTVIGFDHSVLLDFLISSETVFLEYLMEYLRFVLHDWEGFCQDNDDLVEETMTAADVKTEAESFIKSYQKDPHGNDSATVDLPDNEIASTSVDIKTGNYVNTNGLSSKASSVGLGGLSDICVSYGSDTEDDYDKYSSIRHICAGDLVVDIHGDGVYNGNSIDDIGSGCNNDRGDDDDGNNSNDIVSGHNDVNDHVDIDAGDSEEDNIGGKDDDDDDDDDGNNSNDIVSGHNDVNDHVDIDASDSEEDNTGGKDDDDDDDEVGDGDDKMTCGSTLPNVLFKTTAEVSPMLEKTMSTIIHTRIAAERLNKGSLFPYRVKPLINLMKKIENLYDGC